MKLCGYFVPDAPNAPSRSDWPQIQIVLAKIIQNRTQFLTDNELFDEAPERPSHCDDSSSAAPPSHVQPRSKKFPLFRIFLAPCPDTPISHLSFQLASPLFNSGTTGSWNWGRNAWTALQQYWSQVTVTWPDELPEVECAPWVVAAIDAALLRSPETFARADGNTDLICILRTFKSASRRFGHLSKNTCFNQDGPDSKRLRPLWIPQVDSLAFCVHLAQPAKVNAILEQWGEFCLKCEVDSPESSPPWSVKAAWRPWSPESSTAAPQPMRRLRGKQTLVLEPEVLVNRPERAVAPAPSAPRPDAPELSYGDKQAALQAKRRFFKLREHNQKALRSPAHIISASQILERPTCVVCQVQRRRGHWLRLAQSTCASHDPHTCEALVQSEDVAIQTKLDDIEQVLAQKTVRPDITADFERKRQEKTKNESEMSIAEALALPYKRMMRVLNLLGFANAKEAKAALAHS